MNGGLVSGMADVNLRFLVSTINAIRFMSSVISSFNSRPLMALLIAILREGLGQKLGVPEPPLISGLSGFSLHFPIAPG
jgi:hypothetical protein